MPVAYISNASSGFLHLVHLEANYVEKFTWQDLFLCNLSCAMTETNIWGFVGGI